MFDADNYIFDLDGTLIDTAPRILDCLRLSLGKYGIVVDDKMFNNSLIGPKLSDILENIGVDSKLREKVIMNFRVIYNENPCLKSVPFFGVEAYLDLLKSNNKMLFVATNKPINPTKKLLSMFESVQFDDVISPDKFAGKNLDKIQMVNYLIETYDLDPLKTVVIGDTNSDKEAAHKNNCLFVCFAGGYGTSKNLDLKKEDRIFYSYGEIL